MGCIPNGRFLEYNEKKKVWYNVGTGAIPCQRVRIGLLNLVEDEMSNEDHFDKPIIEMTKTERARTMKALRCSEKQLRSSVNLKDARFEIKKELMVNRWSQNPNLYSKVDRGQVTTEPSRKKRKSSKTINEDEVTPFDIMCCNNSSISANPVHKLL